MIAFLGPESILAGNAVYCAVAENGFLNLKSLIYQYINSGLIFENSGLLQQLLPKFESDAGVTSAAFQNCVTQNANNQFVLDVTNNSQVNATPTVLYNGIKLNAQTQLYNENGFKSAVGLNSI